MFPGGPIDRLLTVAEVAERLAPASGPLGASSKKAGSPSSASGARSASPNPCLTTASQRDSFPHNHPYEESSMKSVDSVAFASLPRGGSRRDTPALTAWTAPRRTPSSPRRKPRSR